MLRNLHTNQVVETDKSHNQQEGSAPSWRAQQVVALWCPWYTLRFSPVDMDQSLAVVSEEAADTKKSAYPNKP